MSYDIIYNRQFIKVDEQQVIPFLEMGSNNCYEATGTGRKRARDWGNSFGLTNGKMIVKGEDLLKEIDKLEEETKERCIQNTQQYGEGWEYNPKRFGYHTGVAFYGRHTSSTSFNSFKSYYKNGINEAMTIEELLENDIRITINVYRWLDEDITSKGLEIKPPVTFTSTQHMMDTIKEYEEYYGNKATLYLRCNGGWLIERMKKRITQSKKTQKKEKKPIEVNDFFVLKCKEFSAHYLVKNTRSGYRYSGFIYNSKKFIDEKSAQKFLNNMRNKDLFFIVKIHGSHTFLV
jgi:hypothetical protein